MIIAFICGIIFALIAQFVRLNTFDKIISTALLKSTEVIQILLYAIAVSSVAFFIEYLLGGATVEVKPLYLMGVIVGGLLFGVGIALLGYCPGTMTIALAEGKVDAFFGLIGGVLAGALFTFFYPTVLPVIGPNYGAINLYVENNVANGFIVSAYSITLILIALKLHFGKDK
jgi:uncharacterized membrane protein YedE/YeeE